MSTITVNKIKMSFTVMKVTKAIDYNYVFTDGTKFTITQVATPTNQQIANGYIKAAMTTIPPVSPTNPIDPPPTGTPVNVGDGKTGLTIDGAKIAYTPNSVIIIQPGTYNNGDINIQNLSNLTVVGTGVIINGAALNLSALNGVKIQGITVQNVKGDYLRFNSRLVNTTLDTFTAQNCTGQLRVGYSVKWDKTDNTVQLLGLTLNRCIFDNVGCLYLDGSTSNGVVMNMVKNLTVSFCTFKNSDNGNILDCRAVDGFQVHDNTILNINKTNRDDTRLFMFAGNGDAYNNTFTNICGHSIGLNPISFSPTLRKVSNFTYNITTNTARYSQFENQNFSNQLIPGLTQSGDLVIDHCVAININTEHYEFNGAILDNYIGNDPAIKDLSKVTITNCKLQNAWPVPTKGVFTNMNLPNVSGGNVYIN